MQKRITFGIIILIIAIIAISAYLKHSREEQATNTQTQTQTKTASYLQTLDMEVTNPAIQSTVSSPLTVTGKARGNWFFEASFPVLVTDSQGALVGTGVAQAEGEWMTEELVPFKAEITFTKPSSSPIGFVILKKDNPSGLPENDKQEKFEVTFK